MAITIIKPQDGFQMDFLCSEADICIGGGSAGVGKTFAVLLEPLRHKDIKGFETVIFRKTVPQIKMSGGLWDKSQAIYNSIGGSANVSDLTWKFPGGAKIKMTGLEHDDDVYNHQGGEYGLIIFDELAHFSKKQFFYMLSRNRSVSGVKPYVRATCNPDPDSWLADFIAWWIDQETGLPIPERRGVLRYMIAIGGELVWGDSKDDVIEKAGVEFWESQLSVVSGLMRKEDYIKSVTFIYGSIYENKELLSTNPSYLSNLQAQDDAERAILLDGNWKVSLDNNCIFSENGINDIFTNQVPPDKNRYITCDAAGFGKDLMVIFVWEGWRVVRIIIATKSNDRLIVDAIEEQRKEWGIMKSNVLIDQDGIGGGALVLGGYKGFSGGARPMEDRESKTIENYKNLKTQCFYRFAEKVNFGGVQILCTTESVKVIQEGGLKSGGIRYSKSFEVMIEGKTYYIPDLIKKQFRAIRRKNMDMDGKKQINDKKDQKIILKGMSPDFADVASQRVWFELKPSINFNASKWASAFR